MTYQCCIRGIVGLEILMCLYLETEKRTRLTLGHKMTLYIYIFVLSSTIHDYMETQHAYNILGSLCWQQH